MNDDISKDVEEKLKYNLKMILKLDLAFESYEDNTKCNIPELKQMSLDVNKFRKERNKMTIYEQLDATNYLLLKFNKLLDLVGREKFIFYEDGDVNYIWED